MRKLRTVSSWLSASTLSGVLLFINFTLFSATADHDTGAVFAEPEQAPDQRGWEEVS